MKNFGARNVLFVSVFCFLLLLSPLRGYSDSATVTLISVGGESSGPGYIYPYYFSVNGSADLTPLMCISFTNEISFGESWTATIVPVAGNTQYEEAAYIFAQAYAPGATETTMLEAQWADWELFDPNDPTLLADEPAQYQGDVTALLNQASLYVKNNSRSRIYDDSEIYLPVAGSWPAGDGEPQLLIGDPVPVLTPEPGSLILIGSGLFALAAALICRRRFVRNHSLQGHESAPVVQT
ncbi:MAG: PEP-CTERM sorting domain-containing protein [Terracidiphilus sp.]|jgi:hypothetical protein